MTRNSRLPTVTGRLVALSIVAAVLIMLVPVPSPWGLVLACVTLLLLGSIDVALAPSPSRIGVEREMPNTLPMRSGGIVTWRVINPTRRRQRIAIADELPPSLMPARRRVFLNVPADGAVYAETSITATRRGRFDIAEVVVGTWGPLGLAGRQGSRVLPATLKVYPPFDSRKQAELRIERARVLETGLRSVRGRGGGTEFEQLREYTVDDDYRRLDWAATIRARKPIVRTYRAEQNQNVIVLLDCGRVMAGQVDGVPRLEHAMDAVLALTTVAARLGDRVGLMAFDNYVRSEVAARHGATQIHRVTEAMYQLQPQLLESNFRTAFAHALSRFRRRSLVVLFTELSQHSVQEALAPALPMITRKHVVMIASVTDPDVATWARAVPVETNKAFRKASAIASLTDRRTTVGRLRALGATVVDATPKTLAAEVADAYLKVKATGRL